MSNPSPQPPAPLRASSGLLWPIAALLLIAIPLLISQQVTATITQELGTSADVSNFKGIEDPEVGQSGPFRWGDPTVDIHLQPLGYPLYTVLTVQGVRTQGLPQAQIGATSSDESLGTYMVPRYPITVEYKLPVASLLSINPEITITSTTFQPPGDRRVLGVVFYRVEQRSGPGPSAPSLWPAIALLLSGLLCFVYARRLTRRVRLALTVTAVWGIGIAIINALERPWLVFYSWYFPVLPAVALLTYPWFAGIALRRRQPRPTTEPPTEQPDLTGNAWPVALALTAASIAVMLWHLLAPPQPFGFDPTNNISWGVSFYQALPWPLQAMGMAIVAASLLWAIFAPLVVRGPEKAPDVQSHNVQPSGESSQLPPWTPWALAVGGIALFALLPVAYSEGDSSEFDSKIPLGAIWRERELLDFYVKVRLWRLLRPIFSLPSEIFAIVAVITGGFYLAGSALIARTLGRSRSESLFLIAAMCSIANIILFFRYIESYSTVTALSVFVLWACWRYAEGHLAFGAVAALATLAPFVHGSAIYWAPMVLAAWLVRAAQQPREERWRLALKDLGEGIGVGLAVVMLIVSVVLIDAYNYDRFQLGLSQMGGGDGHTLIQLFQATTHFEYYTYFSLPHLGAVVQEQLLTAPLALITVGILLAGAWKGVKRLVCATPALITLMIGAASMLFFSISWNPDLGPRDDWDLLGLCALPLALLAAYLLLHLPRGRARRLAMAAYLSVSAVHAAAWVGLHVLGIRN